jgi:hypothetical protein
MTDVDRDTDAWPEDWHPAINKHKAMNRETFMCRILANLSPTYPYRIVSFAVKISDAAQRKTDRWLINLDQAPAVARLRWSTHAAGA